MWDICDIFGKGICISNSSLGCKPHVRISKLEKESNILYNLAEHLWERCRHTGNASSKIWVLRRPRDYPHPLPSNPFNSTGTQLFSLTDLQAPLDWRLLLTSGVHFDFLIRPEPRYWKIANVVTLTIQYVPLPFLTKYQSVHCRCGAPLTQPHSPKIL